MNIVLWFVVKVCGIPNRWTICSSMKSIISVWVTSFKRAFGRGLGNILGIDFGIRFLPKHSYLTYGITTFPWNGNIFLVKRLNYPYRQSLPPIIGYPLQPPFAARPSPTDARLPRVFLEMKKIFLRIQSVYQTL